MLASELTTEDAVIILAAEVVSGLYRWEYVDISHHTRDIVDVEWINTFNVK
jgi:hypothetical protein